MDLRRVRADGYGPVRDSGGHQRFVKIVIPTRSLNTVLGKEQD